MKKRVIANPPIGIYKSEDLKLGHLFYLVLLDISARYRTRFLNEQIIFPGNSYNVFGMPATTLLEEEDSQDDISRVLDNKVQERISKRRLVSRLNLLSLDLVVDNEAEIVEGIQRDFLELHKKGYLIQEGSSFYLDCDKISENFGLRGLIDQIKFYPGRMKKKALSFTEENLRKPVKITRPAIYAPENPLNGENIGALFGIANLWDHKYGDASFTMAASHKTFLKYVFLRFLTGLALRGNPGMDEVFIWPTLKYQEDEIPGSLMDLTEDEYQVDILRHALASTHSTKNDTVNFNPNQLDRSRRVVHLIGNLRKGLYHPRSRSEDLSQVEEIYPNYHSDMQSYSFLQINLYLEGKLRLISREMNLLKSRGKFDYAQKQRMNRNLALILEMLEPIVPAISSSVRRENNVFI